MEQISKIIHQTAPSNKEIWHPIWEACQQTWKKCFPSPEYKYFFWNDNDLYELIKNDFPQFLEVYNDFGKHVILKVDFARYAILYKYGGIYADMDFMCKKNFFNQLPNNISIVESIASSEIIQNSLMASPPNDPRWIQVLNNSKDFYYNFIKNNPNTCVTSDRGKHIIDITGPRLLSRAFDLDSIFILPKELFNPSRRCFNSDEIFTKHYGTGKWGPKSGNKLFTDLKNNDKDLYDIYNEINKNKNYNLDNIPEGYLVLECGTHKGGNQKIINLSLSLHQSTKIFVMDHRFNDKMIPLLENNKLVLKRVNGWGWGHNHHVYFTSNHLLNNENNCIYENSTKIKIGKSDLNKKQIKLSVLLNEKTKFELIPSNLNFKFKFTIDKGKNDILNIERTDKNQGWDIEFWISVYDNL